MTACSPGAPSTVRSWPDSCCSSGQRWRRTTPCTCWSVSRRRCPAIRTWGCGRACGDFRPQELGKLVSDRELVRAGLMRGTIHLVTADDCLAMWPWIEPVMRRALNGSFGRFLRDVDTDEIAEAARALLAEQPRTRSELRQLLSKRWPDVDQTALVAAAGYRVPTVQIAPRGVWGSTLQPTLITVQSWLGRPLDAAPDIDGIVMRYFAAYGPASVMDLQAWCGLTKLKEVVERLRQRLLSFRDEAGRELFDVPDAPRPDPETPAPVRFLPEYDNVLLGLADRSRFMPGGEQLKLDVGMRSYGGVLVDGEYTAMWRIERANGTATMLVEQVAPHERRRCACRRGRGGSAAELPDDGRRAAVRTAG